MEEFLNEECYFCNKEFEEIEEVYVDIENDHYVCKKCGKKHRLQIVPVLDSEGGYFQWH